MLLIPIGGYVLQLMAANLVGGIVFYHVDKWILARKSKDDGVCPTIQEKTL
jgi:hypothetical protein